MPIHRTITPALLAANRANARQSTGPRTAQGKAVSSLNAGKHWGRAEAFREFMPALDERPGDFQKVRRDLYQALRPRDGMERALVDDMAEIRWRSCRLLRGETAAQAARRREKKRETDAEEARMAANQPTPMDMALAQHVGWVGVPDSPTKFSYIILILRSVAAIAEEIGFQEVGPEELKMLYSNTPSSAGSALISCYEAGLKAQKSGDAAELARRKQDLGSRADREIARYEGLAAENRQARQEFRGPFVEMALVEKDKRVMENLMEYIEKLERRFQAKWEMLKDYRRTREAEAQAAAEIEAEAQRDENEPLGPKNTTSDERSRQYVETKWLKK